MKTIEEFYGKIDESKSLWEELYSGLNNKNYDTSAPRQAIEQNSVDELASRLAFLFELLYSLRTTPSDNLNSEFGLKIRISEMQEKVGGLISATQGILKQLRVYNRETVALKDINENFNFQFVENSNVIANANLAVNFSQIVTAVKGLLNEISIVLVFSKSTGVSDLSARADGLRKLIEEIEALKEQATENAKQTENIESSSQKQKIKIDELLAASQIVANSVKDIKKNTEQEVSGVNALLAQIKSTGTTSATLEQQITAYKAKFDVFQAQMDTRIKQFSAFEASLAEFKQHTDKSEAEMKRLIAKADTMIRGATTAGLSKSLEDARETYTKRMRNAEMGFILAIVFLTISSLPLAAHLLPGILGDLIPVTQSPTPNDYVGVVGKLLLLLPATWLTVFFTKSHAEYFHLEREYSHKAALAKSVDGFKREAPKYQEEITSSVFGEILNNPANRKSPEPANHPLYEVVTKRLSEWFGKKTN